MTNLKFILLFLIVSLVSSCSILDREGGGDVIADLETIPEESTTVDEPSILIDDQEMMNEADEFTDDDGMSREQQITAGASGTFVGQKIPGLQEDFDAVKEAFNIHRDSYEEVKSRIYAASTQFYGTIAAVHTKLQLGTTPGNPILVKQYDQAQGELKNLESYSREINLLIKK